MAKRTQFAREVKALFVRRQSGCFRASCNDIIDPGENGGKSSEQRNLDSLGIRKGGGVDGKKERSSRARVGYNQMRVWPQKLLDGGVFNTSKSAESRETDSEEGSCLSGAN